MMDQDEDCQPKDLSMKCNKRLKPIPPPLNLGENLSTLKEFAIIATSPRSPLMQKNLPFRKRAHSLSGANEIKQPPPAQQAVAVKNNLCTNVAECSGAVESIPISERKREHSLSSTEGPPQSVEVVRTVSHTNQKSSHFPVITASGGDCIKFCTDHIQFCTDSPGIMVSHQSAYSPCWSPTLGPHSSSFSSVSSVLMSPAGSSREELCSTTNVHPWPAPVWHCFQAGTLIKLEIPNGSGSCGSGFRIAEELSPADWVGALRVECVERVEEDLSCPQLCVRFCCLSSGVTLTAQCHSLHTFFVQEKGWCAVYPEQVAVRYKISCRLLEQGDICCPPQSVLSPDICDRFKRFSFPPEEITVPAPSLLSPPSSPCKKPADTDRPKRPMNAFMLFAKRYRLELIQMHPGKDNRAISVILGEAWRKLPPADKEEYVLEARAMAQEQKRLHPDCWKRKRSHSTS